MDATVEMAVQVCGKLRATIVVPMDSDEQIVVSAALAYIQSQCRISLFA